MNTVALGELLFQISMIPLIFYSLKFYIFGILTPFIKSRKEYEIVSDDKLPTVSIHIPVYNDTVVVNCIKDCLNLDYPKDKIDIIVIDDSTDETTELIRELRKENNGFIHLRRKSRKGFKAGALNYATKMSKGDIIVVFDSDYRFGKDFLKKTVQPFVADEKIAFVQTRWGYLNPTDTFVSKVAAICFNAFHNCSMPIKEKMGTAIFCGSGGAVRRSVLFEINGWNEETLTEDLDMTVRALDKGYKQAYLPYAIAGGEVPSTLKSFIKQQQRWAYGTTKVFKDYFRKILFSKKLSKIQKIDLFVLSSGFLLTFPFILGVTLSSFLTMEAFVWPPQIPLSLLELTISMEKTLVSTFSPFAITLFVISNGFTIYCIIALMADKKYRQIKYIPYIFLVGFVMQITNTIAIFKALFGVKQEFYKTPKVGVKFGHS